jgi:hypothetical protein
MTTTQLATLPPVERAIVALSFETVKAEVSKLATQYADITAISNKAGRDQAHAAAMTLKNRRVEIQRRAKEVREDAVAFQKVVIAKGDELAALIEPEEQRLLKLRDAWDAEQERIKREAAEAEQRRKQGHEAKIADIRSVVVDSSGKSALCLQHIISGLEMEDVSEASFEEYAPVASRAKAETLDKLRAMQAEAEAREAEQVRIKAEQEAEAARLAAEREELARLRAEAEARRKEEERKAAEARAAEEARLAAERAEIAKQREEQEAKARAERAELERQAAELRAQQEAVRKQQEAAAAEAKRLEDERIAAERRAAEEKERAAREEAARVEAKRQAKEREAQRIARESNPPNSDDVVALVAKHYDVSESAARHWLAEMFGIQQAA